MNQLLFADDCLLVARAGKRLLSPKKYAEETDRESSDTESWDSNISIPDFFPLAVNCTTAKPSTPPGNE